MSTRIKSKAHLGPFLQLLGGQLVGVALSMRSIHSGRLQAGCTVASHTWQFEHPSSAEGEGRQRQAQRTLVRSMQRKSLVTSAPERPACAVAPALAAAAAQPRKPAWWFVKRWSKEVEDPVQAPVCWLILRSRCSGRSRNSKHACSQPARKRSGAGTCAPRQARHPSLKLTIKQTLSK